MAVTTLPTSTTDANYRFDVDLDGVVYRLAFKFNSRDDSWYVSIFDESDKLLRAGIRIVNETPLLWRWAEAVRPAGELIAVPQGAQTVPAELNQLGSEVLLTYLDEAEVEALG